MGKEQVKLKDPQTTFHDPETRLKVTGSQVAEIDPKKGKGKLTAAAIAAGGLIEVNRESKSASQTSGDNDDDESDLPADFPTRKKLIDAGFDSVDKVKAASDEQLLEVVSQRSVDNIREAVK